MGLASSRWFFTGRVRYIALGLGFHATSARPRCSALAAGQCASGQCHRARKSLGKEKAM